MDNLAILEAVQGLDEAVWRIKIILGCILGTLAEGSECLGTTEISHFIFLLMALPRALHWVAIGLNPSLVEKRNGLKCISIL